MMTSRENSRGKGGVKQSWRVRRTEKTSPPTGTRPRPVPVCGGEGDPGVETYRPTSEDGSGNKRNAVRPGMCVAMWGLSNEEPTDGVCDVSSVLSLSGRDMGNEGLAKGKWRKPAFPTKRRSDALRVESQL